MIKAIALVLVCCMTQSYALAAPTAPTLTGRLTTRGNGTVYVNGSLVDSGMTILSGAQIATPEGIGATIDLGSVGQLDVAPNANLTLTFAAGKLSANVNRGCVVLNAARGVDASVTTPEGATEHNDPTSFAPIDVCLGNAETTGAIVNRGAALEAGAGASVAVPQGGSGGSGSGGSGISKRVAGILIVSAFVATTVIIIAVTGDDDPASVMR